MWGIYMGSKFRIGEENVRHSILTMLNLINVCVKFMYYHDLDLACSLKAHVIKACSTVLLLEGDGTFKRWGLVRGS
jgi:hypothetical protein